MTHETINKPTRQHGGHPVVRLIRPKQWIKNLIVLLPVFFGGALLQPEPMTSGLITAVSFSFAASSIYCLNDLIDVEDDRRHPVKCARPIASGQVSVRKAWGLMGLMFVLSMAVLLLLPENRWETGGVIVFYWLLNIAYCMRLKQYAIIDVCIVAFGFVLRLLAGGLASGIFLSKWIVLMTFLLMLFLSFAKRRDDVVRMNETGEAPRKNTIRYNLTFINQAITITASVTLVCYIMYTVSPEGRPDEGETPRPLHATDRGGMGRGLPRHDLCHIAVDRRTVCGQFIYYKVKFTYSLSNKACILLR